MKWRLDRFWGRVDRRGPDECWPRETSNPRGYSRLNVEGRIVGAHNYAYEIAYGPVQIGLLPHNGCE